MLQPNFVGCPGQAGARRIAPRRTRGSGPMTRGRSRCEERCNDRL